MKINDMKASNSCNIQVVEGSGCFFHDKMIAPVLLISNWLLPPR